MLKFVLLLLPAFASAQNLEEWIAKQENQALTRLLKNISPSDALKGAVIASPSRKDPDYYFHWVRDAALVMDVLGQEMITSSKITLHDFFPRIMDYVSFNTTIQDNFALTGLGEPKYHVNGLSYQGPWGRPQNDGPALRSLYLTRIALKLLEEGEKEIVEKHFYQSTLPALSLIKRDLEYVAHEWMKPSFDLWEEVKAMHFYTLMVQRQSLIEGAKLATLMNDLDAAIFYQKVATKIEEKLSTFFREDQILASLDYAEGIHYKQSNLDIATLLAVLHTGKNSLVSIDNLSLEETVKKLNKAFYQVYPINQKGLVANLLGRYPEDQYYGGNPWILTTLAVAEYHYLRASKLKSWKEFDMADEYLKRIQYHSRSDGSMSEQLDKNNGFMLSAEELTWSYASFLTTIRERKKAISDLN